MSELDASLQLGRTNIEALRLEESTLQSTIAELNECIAALMQDGQNHQQQVEELKAQREKLTSDIDQCDS